MSKPTWPAFLLATGEKLLRFDSQNPTTVEEGRGVYYGISWSSTHVYCHRRNGPWRLGGTGEVVVYSPTYEFVGILPGDFPDAHQVYYHSGNVYVTATSRNSIGVVDAAVGTVEFKNWTPFDHDVNHINSIWFDGSSFWVGCHNYAEKDSSSYESSQVVCLDGELSTVLRSIEIGVGLHNVVVLNGVLYVCSSGDGKLIGYDLSSGEVVRELYVGEWLRGIAITDDFIVLGASATLPKDKRLEGDSAVYLLNREFEVLDKMVIPGCGPVYDLRVTNQPDYAHNLEPFPGTA